MDLERAPKESRFIPFLPSNIPRPREENLPQIKKITIKILSRNQRKLKKKRINHRIRSVDKKITKKEEEIQELEKNLKKLRIKSEVPLKKKVIVIDLEQQKYLFEDDWDWLLEKDEEPSNDVEMIEEEEKGNF